MNTPISASIVLFAICSNVNAADLIRLEPAPRRIHTEYLSSTSMDANGRVTAVNGIPVEAEIPSLRREAVTGDTRAQILLSKALDRHGIGATNRVEAYMWAVVASTRGGKEAKGLVKDIGLFLTDEERAQGRAKADSFVPTVRKSP